jgi:Uncharacterized protein conserved in bacteria (DUF2188)
MGYLVLCAAGSQFPAKHQNQGGVPVQGDYAVRKPGSERASAVQPTQGKAIDRARELNPDAGLRVERVRNTKAGSPDKWRKA